MSSPFTARQAGLASIAAAGLILVSQLSQVVIPMILPESFWIATQSLRMGLAFVAAFALLIALTGLYSTQAASAGRLGLVGYLTASLGTLLIAGDWWYEAFIGPALRQQAPQILATAPSGSVLIGAIITAGVFGLGWVIFGLASLRAGVFSRGAAVLMTLGGVVGLLALIAPFEIPLAIALGWIGFSLLRSNAGAEEPTGSRVVALA